MNSNEYMRKYMLVRYHERMQAAHTLLGGKCVQCGRTTDLEIDHIDPQQKSFTVSKMWSISKERFLQELSKCQLLCKECHNFKTLDQVGKKSAKGTHGTRSSYRYCKCNICKKAWSDWGKAYRFRKKQEVIQR